MRTFLALALVAVCASAHADPADDLLAKNLAARGGAEKLRAIKSLKLTGRIVFGGTDFSIDAAWGTDPAPARSDPQRGHAAGADLGQRVRRARGVARDAVRRAQGRREGQRGRYARARAGGRHRRTARRLAGEGPQGRVRSASRTSTARRRYKLRVTRQGRRRPVRLPRSRRRTSRSASRRSTRCAAPRRSTRRISAATSRSPACGSRSRSRAAARAARGRAAISVERAEINVPIEDAWFKLPHGPGRARDHRRRPARRSRSRSRCPRRRRRRCSIPAPISGLGARNIGSAAMSGRIAAVAACNEGGKTTLYVGAASRRRVEVARRRHDVQAGVRQAARAVDRRDRDRSDATRRPCGSAPASRGRATRSRSATASTSPPTAARPGRTWACPSPSASCASSCTRSNSNVVYACVPGKLWSDCAGSRPLQDQRRRQDLDARAQGREPVDRLLGRSRWTRRTPTCCFAGMWDFRRKGWTFRSGGDGPDAASGSGLFRSTDGGKTWTPLTASTNRGLPADAVGPRRGRASRRPIAKRRLRADRVEGVGALSAPTTAARPGRSATRAR